MKRSDVKSNRVGRAMLATGGVTTGYRALVAFECVLCARTIAPGELFSRRSRHTPSRAVGMPTNDPVCIACRPFCLEGIDEGL